MLSKNELKYIQSLCHKKLRLEEGLFIAEGVKLVDELLQSNYIIKKIYATSVWIEKHVSSKVEVVEVSETELERISSLQTPNQVLAIVEQKQMITAPVFQKQWTIILDNIQDPGNFGTIIRIADWFGIKQIICSNDTVELHNPKVIQSTMGSFIRVNVWYNNLSEILQSTNMPILGALLEGKSIYHFPKMEEGIIVIGNESKGIHDSLKKLITHPVTIPKIGEADSLNAAVAAGIIVSHLIGTE